MERNTIELQEEKSKGMPKLRNIIKIDEEKCNGCGLCIPNCPEGALKIIDGKARLISDLFCDGLGACIGHCPENAITIEEREAVEYDEGKVMENIVKQGKNVIKAHIEHLEDHNERELLKEAIEFLKEKNLEIPLEEKRDSHETKPQQSFDGCPGSIMMDFTEPEVSATGNKPASSGISQLRQWPVQIMLVPPTAPYLRDAHLLIAADCVPFAYADFHEDLLQGKVALVGCPKLDDAEFYREKFTYILKSNNIQSVTCAHMEVPCCFGLKSIIESAISESGKDILLDEVTINVRGKKLL